MSMRYYRWRTVIRHPIWQFDSRFYMLLGRMFMREGPTWMYLMSDVAPEIRQKYLSSLSLDYQEPNDVTNYDVTQNVTVNGVYGAAAKMGETR